MTITPSAPVIARGTSVELTAVGTFSDGSFQELTDDVIWISRDEAVASIDGNGRVQGLQAGQTEIRAVFGQVRASAPLTVTSANLIGLTVEGGVGSIALGTSTQFTALGTFSDGSTQNLTSSASWSSSAPGVVGVELGRAQGLAVGSSTVSATFASLSGQAVLEVTAAMLTSVRVETVPAGSSTLVNVGETLPLRAVATFSDLSEQEITADALWTVEDATRASVAEGIVSGEQAGQTRVVASFGDRSGSLQVTVVVAVRPSLTLSPGVYGFDTDAGELTPLGGPAETPAGWNPSEGRLLLDSFTVEAGATLFFTGSRAFRVRADSTILIAGELNFEGADGPNAVLDEDGGDGANGGNIDLFASGDLTVTGRITTDGGDGGAAGGLVIPGINGNTVVGRSGGRGGDAGVVTLSAGGSLVLEAAVISMDGGDGGAGGGVEIGESSFGSVTGGAGGTGGAGASQGAFYGRGGTGGAGGPVTVPANGGALIGGPGGAGGAWGGDGGAGGEVTVSLANFGSVVGGRGGTGAIGPVGGRGGAGGGVAMPGSNEGIEAVVTGGAGGAGGQGSEDGGTGGPGGNVAIGFHNPFATAVGGSGGTGGRGGTTGGSGGAGGSVTISLSTTGTVVGGAGGPGGEPGGAPGPSGTTSP